MTHVPGPDFPTAASINGVRGINEAYHTGRGRIYLRARTEIEIDDHSGRQRIIVTELPYQVNKANLIEKIAELVRDKRIEGIGELRDESDRHGMRIVIELRRDAVSDVVLNQLYRHTQLQTSFGCNMLALTGGRPEMFNLKGFIGAFIDFRETVITRRTRFELDKARDRAHVLVGLAIAVANIDRVIAMIRGAPTPADARQSLMAVDWPAGEATDPRDMLDWTRSWRDTRNTFRNRTHRL